MKKTKLVVITGGPGGGKTAILEMAKKHLLKESIILPEAASIIFGGGFWRLPSISAKACAQRAILHIQIEMEKMVCEEKKWDLVLCDRGSLDGLAYWPLDKDLFFKVAETTLESELKKYYAVIHLRSPSRLEGYNHENPLRTETAEEAELIDEKIAEIWKNHPRYEEISSTSDFLLKAKKALDIILDLQKD